MPAQLVSLGDGPNIALAKPILLLGRQAECDIVLNSRKISRRHCCIAQVHGHLAIRDLDSTNGVRINGERVVNGALQQGDELAIGNFRYRVALDPSEPHRTPVPEPWRGSSESIVLEAADEPVALDESGKK